LHCILVLPQLTANLGDVDPGDRICGVEQVSETGSILGFERSGDQVGEDRLAALLCASSFPGQGTDVPQAAVPVVVKLPVQQAQAAFRVEIRSEASFESLGVQDRGAAGHQRLVSRCRSR
jgi:hypothetical protein